MQATKYHTSHCRSTLLCLLLSSSPLRKLAVNRKPESASPTSEVIGTRSYTAGPSRWSKQQWGPVRGPQGRGLLSSLGAARA